ncbi:MAG TPA: VWA domain-containing protein [Blastocatellia bacterium]|nr:VWA domain-containing protein [Blastocatellia bacterium]
MKYRQSKHYRAAVILMTFMALAFAGVIRAEQGGVSADGRDVTITVTVHPHNDRARANAQKLQPSDFAVREEKRPQKIISVKRASEAPPIIAVLIQDDLVSRVNNEIRGIKSFIRNLPEGSRVMTGYLTVGTLTVTQDFTTDRERAADSLRIIRSSPSAAPFNPYVEVVEALRRFDSQPAGRRMILLVSDGLDASRGLRSASPTLSIDLDRAVREAQRRGVSVFTFFAPSTGLTSASRIANNFGQGSLNRFADETGGEAFFTGTDFVSFDSYFKELNQLFGNQWLITYRSTNTGSDYREIEVTTELDVHLHYPSGYKPASGR